MRVLNILKDAGDSKFIPGLPNRIPVAKNGPGETFTQNNTVRIPQGGFRVPLDKIECKDFKNAAVTKEIVLNGDDPFVGRIT